VVYRAFKIEALRTAVQELSKKIEFYKVFFVQAYQTSQYVVPRGGIFLGK
jgi:hypothetical protein